MSYVWLKDLCQLYYNIILPMAKDSLTVGPDLKGFAVAVKSNSCYSDTARPVVDLMPLISFRDVADLSPTSS